jgi:N4-gp56 family major capsid protein
MTVSRYPTQDGAVGVTAAGSFIPEIWSDEIRAEYEKSLVIAPKVKKISMTGKKGDTVNIPAPERGSASVKQQHTAVNIQNNVEGNVPVIIDKHYEYSRFIEDIVEVQALSSLRKFYTDDAGYALAKQIDTDLLDLAKTLGNNTGTYVNTASFYTEAGTGVLKPYAADTIVPADVFTDATFRNLIQKMDDADVPMDDRCFVIPPSLRNAIMGVDRYVSSDFVNGQGTQNGKIGELYGIDIMVSTNCPVIEEAADNGAADGGRIRSAQLLHKDTYVLAEQQGIRSQTQYKQEFLSTLYTADTLYGVKCLRPDSGFSLAVNG